MGVSVNISFFSSGRGIRFSKIAGIWAHLPSKFITKWLKRGHVKNIPSLNLELWNKCFAKIFQKHPTLNYGRHPIQFWIKAQEKRERFNFLPWNSSTLNSSFRWNSPGTWVGQKNPIIIRATGALFQHPKSGLGMTNWCYWSECLPNGGVSWLLWKP